jgi:hypothetical protein
MSDIIKSVPCSHLLFPTLTYGSTSQQSLSDIIQKEHNIDLQDVLLSHQLNIKFRFWTSIRVGITS